MGADTVLVTFCSEYWARVWLKETGSPFPLLLDPERASFRSYGLLDSKWRAWGPRSVLYYLKALAGGRKIHGARGQTGQLGGNFIIDPEKRLRFAHSCADPTDRPSIDLLKTEIRQLTLNPGTRVPAPTTHNPEPKT